MKNKILVITFVSFLEIFFILNILIKDKEISVEERRKLNTFPKVSINNIISTNFMDDFEDYALDQFPFRNSFRSLKANYNYFVLQMLDNNNIYIDDNYIFKIEYPMNISSIDNFINKINNIIENTTNKNNIYSVIIPDKNYFIQDNLFLNMDYDLMYSKLNKLNTTKIDITNIMNLDDYYNTDTHWRQENLNKVILKLSEIMNFKYSNIKYYENIYDNFYGVYYGQSALNKNPDKLIYLTNDLQNNLKITYLENSTLHSLYNTNKLNSLDSYEVFLDGASSFITIENDESINDKELIIFRDSFGSSIVPLLTPYYKKITVIDTRYISSQIYKDKIKFVDQDILFLYNTILVNNSFTLKD